MNVSQKKSIMKQAILITAYKDVQSLVEIVDFFDDNFNFYIHIDRKSKLDCSSLIGRSNIHICDKFTVNWGGFNHLRAILHLATEALNDDNVYFHLITGEDFPIKSISHFTNIDLSKNYLKYYEMPASVWKDNGGFDRIDYFQYYDLFNYKTSFGKMMIEQLVWLQKKISFKRKRGRCMPQQLFGGSTYWSLNKKVLEYVVNYVATNRGFLSRFKNTFCAEEILFHTVILNSPYANTVVNTHLRYIDWDSGRGGYPAYLDVSDFESILYSDNLFARKIKASEKLRYMLKEHFQKK